MSEEVTFPASSATVQEFEHPNGETGVLIGLRSTARDIADAYDINPAVNNNDPAEVDRLRDKLDDSPVVFPLKHKADGATNFDTYREEGDDLVVVHTDDQYEQVRSYFEHTLLYE